MQLIRTIVNKILVWSQKWLNIHEQQQEKTKGGRGKLTGKPKMTTFFP
uniref:Uncharacterized protein n=1 Tax=Arundo donax TaxID=35708 RepID=A0A0A9APL7_ARUDO